MTAAYRRKDRPSEGYRIWPTLPLPYGRVGPWQTGLKRKQQAEAVERWLQEAVRTRPEIIDALLAGKFTLQDAWVANLRNSLDDLLSGLNDPKLEQAVEAYRPRVKDVRIAGGLTLLLKYAPDGMRLSQLQGKAIAEIFTKALAGGLKPNSVHRSVHRAIGGLLTYHLGAERRRAAYEGITVPSEDDTREVDVTPAELRTLIDACKPPEFQLLIITAITTAIDRKPLLALKPRHINEKEAELIVPDKKTIARPRRLRLSSIAVSALTLAARGKEVDEPLFDFAPAQVSKLFEAARAEANLEHVRFKDLRHMLPTMLAAMNVDRREIQAYMGHVIGSKSTDRYIRPTGDVSLLDQAAELMGLEMKLLRIANG